MVGKKSDAILGVFASFSNSNVYSCVEIIAHIKEVGNNNNEWDNLKYKISWIMKSVHNSFYANVAFKLDNE